MIVTLKPGPGAIITIITKDGKTIPMENIVAVKVVPFFTSARSQGEMFRGECVAANGVSVDKFHLIAYGESGKVQRREPVEMPAESAIPYIDSKSAKKPEPRPAIPAAIPAAMPGPPLKPLAGAGT